MRPAAQFALDPPIGDFVDGGPEELSPVAIERIYLFNERLGMLPELLVGDGYVSMAYQRWPFDEDGVHLFMRVEDGAVQQASVGDGSDHRSTPEHPRVSWILKDYGMPANEELPLNYYL